MSARLARSLGSAALLVAMSACATSSATDVAFDRAATATLDVSAFQRVLVAGFVVGGTTEIDANEETVRLLRSQLRSKTSLKVIDGADVLPLTEMAAAYPSVSRPAGSNGKSSKPGVPRHITGEAGEEDLRAYEVIFANTAYWKRLGEEYLDPIIVTGTVLFTVDAGPIFARRDPRDREKTDPFVRGWVISKNPVGAVGPSCTLRSKFIFIDGRTGAPLYSEVFRATVSYDADKSVPALSSYFELMDRILPSFLGTVSTQNLRTTRALLK